MHRGLRGPVRCCSSSAAVRSCALRPAATNAGAPATPNAKRCCMCRKSVWRFRCRLPSSLAILRSNSTVNHAAAHVADATDATAPAAPAAALPLLFPALPQRGRGCARVARPRGGQFLDRPPPRLQLVDPVADLLRRRVVVQFLNLRESLQGGRSFERPPLQAYGGAGTPNT